MRSRLLSSLTRLFHSGRGACLGPAAAVAATMWLCGCGATASVSQPRVETGGLQPAAAARLGDAEFAGAVRDLLLSTPGTPQRQRLLAAVEARQMERAAQRFRDREPLRGLNDVIGGLYLLRTGELANDTLGPAGRDAVREAVKELAQRGDEGRARALYEVLLRLVPDEAKADVQRHLDAIAAWTRDESARGHGMVGAGMLESASVTRSVLEPSDSARADAAQAALNWIATAVDLQNHMREKRARPSREEYGEAVRALRSGGDVLARIFLRSADAASALAALSRSPAPEAIRPDLQRALGALGASPTAAQWLDILHAIVPASPQAGAREEEEDAANDDAELMRAATFGVAAEAYRLDPTQREPAALVAEVLQDVGMAEASPPVLVQAVQAHADPRTVSGALTLVLRAMHIAFEMSDFDAIRRTYAAAAPLLDLASQREIAPHLSPSGAQLRAMMGEVELEQGAVAEARTLLRAAAGEEPSGAVLLSLARIDRHDGQPSAALQDLRSALDARDARHDAALHGEVLLLQSDLFHDLRDAAGARAPLVDALELLSRSRAAGPPEARARVEQVLARVLDRFGATDKARQASERALEAAPHDKHMVAAALGQIVARALVQGDLLAAREGLARGVAAELDDDEVVYLALWVRLLERQMRQARDVAGAPAASVFARIPDSGRWIGKLAAFGAGKLSAADLPAFARTGAEKTEATFYQAMDRRVSGGADGGATELRAVLQGDGVELMETVIARDILRKEAHEAPLGIPADVKLP